MQAPDTEGEPEEEEAPKPVSGRRRAARGGPGRTAPKQAPAESPARHTRSHDIAPQEPPEVCRLSLLKILTICSTLPGCFMLMEESCSNCFLAPALKDQLNTKKATAVMTPSVLFS